MKIVISDDAKKFLEDKNVDEFTIESYQAKACCGSGMPLPSVYVGAPKHTSKNYNVYEIDGYKIYAENVLKFKNDICHVEIEKYLFAKNLTAEFLDYSEM